MPQLLIPFITDVICTFFLKKDTVNRNSKTKIHMTHMCLDTFSSMCIGNA